MPLNPSGLITDLNSLFSSPPDNITACANAWGNALQAYASSIVPPSTTVTAASTTLKTTLATTFQSNGSAAMLTTFEANLLTWATTIGGGMAGYTSVPPPGPMGLASLSDASSHVAGAINFEAKIDDWMRTGVSTLIAFPFTVVIWS